MVDQHKRSYSHYVKEILQSSGFRGFYRGYLATLVSFGPYSGLYFSIFEYLRSITQADHISSLVLLSGISGASAGFLTSPFDLLKTRIQVKESFALSHILKHEGMLSMWKGCFVRSLRCGLLGSFHLSTYT